MKMLILIGGVTIAIAASVIYLSHSRTSEAFPSQHAPTPSHRSLEYELAGTDTRFDSGSLSIRNRDRGEWSAVRVELWVHVSPGNRNIKFACASPANIQPGDLLTVPYRICASPLPLESDSASVSSVHVNASQGAIQIAFEPGLPLRGPESDVKTK